MPCQNQKSRSFSSFSLPVFFAIAFVPALFFAFPGTACSQEKLSGLQGNPIVTKANKSLQSHKRLKSAQADTLVNLPLIDDFSSTLVFPDTKYWADHDVFINSTNALNPWSVGVATFDDIDSSGQIYSRATVTPFEADNLTSRPINLNFPSRNDIWLSFLYEPGGLLDPPSTGDSLILEFLSDSTKTWKKVWAAPGDSLNNFRRAMINVEPEYRYAGFKFRFRNLATLASNDTPGIISAGDQWHLDYVKLDTGRNQNDTILKDIAFIKPLQSVMKNYQSMPWKHFKEAFRSELDSVFRISYRNNDNITRNVMRHIDVSVNGKTSPLMQPNAENIAPGTVFNFSTDFTNPFTENAPGKISYDFKSYIDKINDADILTNDTVEFSQVFDNYMAYDDGTSENGYGLYGEGSQNGRVAYQFTAFVQDTLTAVDIYFNPVANNTTSRYYFNLGVWTDNKDRPGNLIYVSQLFSPEVSRLNEFHRFSLDTAIVVKGNFYIGWIQSDDSYLNIGFDINHNHENFLFYNLTGIWENSGYRGTLMMRPVFNVSSSIPTEVKSIENQQQCTLYPNPARSYFSIKNNTPVFYVTSVSIFNTVGQLIRTWNNPLPGQFGVSELKPGIYLIKITTSKGETEIFKLLKEM